MVYFRIKNRSVAPSVDIWVLRPFGFTRPTNSSPQVLVVPDVPLLGRDVF